jgi:hypothetical protein
MGDSLPKRRDDLALGRALPDPEKTDDDFPDLNPIVFFLILSRCIAIFGNQASGRIRRVSSLRAANYWKYFDPELTNYGT